MRARRGGHGGLVTVCKMSPHSAWRQVCFALLQRWFIMCGLAQVGCLWNANQCNMVTWKYNDGWQWKTSLDTKEGNFHFIQIYFSVKSSHLIYFCEWADRVWHIRYATKLFSFLNRLLMCTKVLFGRCVHAICLPNFHHIVKLKGKTQQT